MLISIYCIFLCACSVTKKSTQDPNVQIIKADVNNKDKNAKSKDSSSLESNKQNKNATNPKMDTVLWQDISNIQKSIKIVQRKPVEYREGLEFRDKYYIKLLIPLNSNQNKMPSDPRFINFYAGVLRGLEILEDEGLHLQVKVYDTEENSIPIREKTKEIFSEPTDLVIGPYDREDVRYFAEECKNKNIPLVSPWQTSTKITNENPYYIQMNPNLKEHYLKLVEYTTDHFKKGEVCIVGRNNKETNSWISYFQESATTRVNETDYYTTHFINEDSLKRGNSIFNNIYRSGVKAVIFPNYSYNDEDFLYSNLRRLSAERGSKQIAVFGMPIMYDSEKIDFDFYHALNMHIVMNDFVDKDYGLIREFRRDFLDMYGEIPTSDAVKGYDLILYLGRNLWKYGKNFQNYLENEATSALQSVYEIKKSKSDDSPVANDPFKFDYFENKHLDIIGFRGNKWQIAY